MELNHLRYFYEVAKAGSFTAASKALRISQPSLSKTVALLEEREGVKLLERGKKGVSLTPMGEQIYAKCDGIFRELEDLGDQIRGYSARCEGPLRLGASDHVANYLLLDPLQTFRKKHPLVFPSIFTGTPTETVMRILERDLEFGLFFTRIASPAIEYRPLASVEFVAVFKPSAENRPPSASGDRKAFLSRLGFIGSRAHDYRKHHPAEELLERLGAERKLQLETNNQETQKRLAKIGYGYAVLPRFMVEKEIQKKELAEVPGERKMFVDLLFAKRKNYALSVPAQKFLESLEISLKSMGS